MQNNFGAIKYLLFALLLRVNMSFLLNFWYHSRYIYDTEAVPRGCMGLAPPPCQNQGGARVIFESVDNVSTLLDKCFNIVIYVCMIFNPMIITTSD